MCLCQFELGVKGIFTAKSGSLWWLLLLYPKIIHQISAIVTWIFKLLTFPNKILLCPLCLPQEPNSGLPAAFSDVLRAPDVQPGRLYVHSEKQLGFPYINVEYNILNICFCMSGDSWMYPYQRTPMGNPYNISPISRGYLWVSSPQESQGTPNCSLNNNDNIIIPGSSLWPFWDG